MRTTVISLTEREGSMSDCIAAPAIGEIFFSNFYKREKKLKYVVSYNFPHQVSPITGGPSSLEQGKGAFCLSLIDMSFPNWISISFS